MAEGLQRATHRSQHKSQCVKMSQGKAALPRKGQQEIARGISCTRKKAERRHGQTRSKTTEFPWELRTAAKGHGAILSWQHGCECQEAETTECRMPLFVSAQLPLESLQDVEATRGPARTLEWPRQRTTSEYWGACSLVNATKEDKANPD